MRISDWSSDVCSSDLGKPHRAIVQAIPVDMGVERTGERRTVVEAERALAPRLRQNWRDGPGSEEAGHARAGDEAGGEAVHPFPPFVPAHPPERSERRRSGDEVATRLKYKWVAVV